MYLDESRAKKIGGYDQEIPQSQIADKSMAFREIKFGHKNTPPPKPYGSGFIMQYFPILTHLTYRANVKKCDISNNNSQLMCVMADAICYWNVRRCNDLFMLERRYKYM